MGKINDRIKAMRIQNGFTLREVAERIGVKEATMQRYESGNIKNIKHEVICKLADIFGCDPSYLMGWSTESNLNNTSITNSAVAHGNNTTALILKSNRFCEREISEQAMELLRIFESLAVKEQTELLALAYQLEDKEKEDKKKIRNPRWW